MRCSFRHTWRLLLLHLSNFFQTYHECPSYCLVSIMMTMAVDRAVLSVGISLDILQLLPTRPPPKVAQQQAIVAVRIRFCHMAARPLLLLLLLSSDHHDKSYCCFSLLCKLVCLASLFALLHLKKRERDRQKKSGLNSAPVISIKWSFQLQNPKTIQITLLLRLK